MSKAMEQSSGLPRELATPAGRLAAALGRALGWRLVSLYAYGSAVRGGYRPGASDLNLLVVLDHVEAADLLAVAECRRPLGKAPLTLAVIGEDELPALLAATPLTLLDVRDAHVLLAGRHVLEQAAATRDALVAQVRLELRDKLAGLRADALTCGRDGRRLAALLNARSVSLLHAVRGLARLAELDLGAAVESWAQPLGLSADSLLTLARTARGQSAVRPDRAAAHLALLLDLLAAALAKAEALAAPPAEPPAKPKTRSRAKAKQPQPEPASEPQPEPEPVKAEPAVEEKAAEAAPAAADAAPATADAAPEQAGDEPAGQSGDAA